MDFNFIVFLLSILLSSLHKYLIIILINLELLDYRKALIMLLFECLFHFQKDIMLDLEDIMYWHVLLFSLLFICSLHCYNQ